MADPKNKPQVEDQEEWVTLSGETLRERYEWQVTTLTPEAAQEVAFYFSRRAYGRRWQAGMKNSLRTW